MNLNYPAELPVVAHREEILAALRSHPVVIVSGDTGSGKTTQLPKMALEAGLAAGGHRIAVTQPRRLAAVTMAERVAEELSSPVGGLVGYQHRFGRQVSADTRVKFMTDGVLLAETRGDPLLRAYDCIIVDEAHERSLNVDFLLGILKRILARRRDLKVIISSATLDTERFSAFFDHAPAIAVPGRLYPVEIVYRPPPEDAERDLAADVADAVRELPPRDDILVFLPGERDIRDTADELEHRFGDANEVIPLLASLPAAEQRRAFRLAPRRRIVLATNVAETSVTIPGIRAVIDSGLARISRYVHRTQVQRLQIEPVSQASARQRAGRCGRLGPGTCIRLYSEEDFQSRDAFTPPEVLRSSLAGVILAMLDLRLGDIAEFPFIDPPKPAMIHEGYRELLELRAIERRGMRDGEREIELTSIGKTLARMPIEPRLARMLVAASDGAVLAETIPVVAALSCDDPRRRPIDEKEKATAAHAPFRVPGSDFLGTLKLWRWWETETRELSQSKSRALAKKTYLSYPKMREWRDLVRQLTELAKHLELSFANPDREFTDETADRLHRALLSGLLGRIGRYDEEERDYRGAHGLRFALHPSSVLTKKVKGKGEEKHSNNRRIEKSKNSPLWIIAGELTDTSRLFARNAAEIDPTWIEPVAGDLCKRSYREASWDARFGFARVIEQVTLYGLVIVPSRRRDLFGIAPKLAREIFIKDGLVGGAYPHPPPVVQSNLSLLRALRERAEKTRHPELFDERKLFEHFDAVLPDDVASADALRRWLRRARPADISRFTLQRDEWWPRDETSDRDFPNKIRLGDTSLALVYHHAPDDPETDGITCVLRRRDIPVLRLWQSDWLVPGALPEKLAWMLSVLPSSLRRALAPLDEKVTVLVDLLQPGSESLRTAVIRAVYERWGFRIPPTAWDNAREPAHFSIRFSVRDDQNGKTLLETRDLAAVLRLAPGSATPSAAAKAEVPSREWSFGKIPETCSGIHAGWSVPHYPALAVVGDGVLLRQYPNADTARRIHANGVARLFILALAPKFRRGIVSRELTTNAALRMKKLEYPAGQLADDIFAGAVREALVADLPPVRDAETFARRPEERRGELVAIESEIRKLALASLDESAALQIQLGTDPRLSDETVASVATQLAWMTCRGFPAFVPMKMLRRYPAYLKAVRLRLERARNSPSSDRAKESRFAPHWDRYVEAVTGPDKSKLRPEPLADYRRMLEEYRLSLFAQELKTAEPVSPQRLDATWGLVIS